MYITYTNVNGYLIPNLTYKSGEQMEQPGKDGFLRRDYLKNHRNSMYQVMLLRDTIGEHLLEMDKAAREREEVILKQLEEKDPLSDEEKDQMAWIKTFWYWMSKHQRGPVVSLERASTCFRMQRKN
ncbi:MAG: TnpV protein [Roseburia inulinivorans]